MDKAWRFIKNKDIPDPALLLLVIVIAINAICMIDYFLDTLHSKMDTFTMQIAATWIIVTIGWFIASNSASSDEDFYYYNTWYRLIFKIMTIATVIVLLLFLILTIKYMALAASVGLYLIMAVIDMYWRYKNADNELNKYKERYELYRDRLLENGCTVELYKDDDWLRWYISRKGIDYDDFDSYQDKPEKIPR